MEKTGVVFSPLDVAGVDSLLMDDERSVRASVHQACDTFAEPYVAEWFERGEIGGLRELAVALGDVGVLGMHLSGYGCAGMSAVDYGVAYLDLMATDSGLRSLVSVQGSLAMFALHAFGSEEQKHAWLPSMASGRAIGCFGLTEPDSGSDPSSMRTHAVRDGDDLPGGLDVPRRAPAAAACADGAGDRRSSGRPRLGESVRSRRERGECGGRSGP